jgi:hypothetical protein
MNWYDTEHLKKVGDAFRESYTPEVHEEIQKIREEKIPCDVCELRKEMAGKEVVYDPCDECENKPK